jgi:hypothetical protein
LRAELRGSNTLSIVTLAKRIIPDLESGELPRKAILFVKMVMSRKKNTFFIGVIEKKITKLRANQVVP